jgi:tetrahydromethanopterin S-methyltransferase subunit G
MYAELLVRREEMAKKLENATAEEIQALGKEQLQTASQNQDL